MKMPAETSRSEPITISIVTPSFNQGVFLEDCLRSVENQQYGNVEYFVMDGGSTDDSVEIIRRHAGRLAGWRSRPDGGQMAAVQEGLERSTGEVMGWLNSDDMLTPWALRVVAEVFQRFPDVQWISSLYPMIMNEDGLVVGARRGEGYYSEAFYRGRNLPLNSWFYSNMIQQESTFWRRSLWERAGARVDVSLRGAGDFELWCRFFEHATLYSLSVPLGIFRFQRASFTATKFGAYLDESRRVLAKYKRRTPGRIESLARRVARELPDRWQPLTGLAYPTARIVRARGPQAFEIRRGWIV
jgi:glycosyltransferase involved in cell wall biosynthesis